MVEKFLTNVVVKEEWRENFRMTKKTFMELCDELRPFFQRTGTTTIDIISFDLVAPFVQVTALDFGAK